MTWNQDELEPRREWTRERRLLVATWALIFGNLLGVLQLAPIGDGGLQQAAELAGVDDGPARHFFWITIAIAAVVGNGVGAAAAATRQRWAIVPPLVATIASWTGFVAASALV